MSFFQTIDPRRIPGSIPASDSMLVFRERILQYILLGLSALGALAYAAGLVTSLQRGLWSLVILYTVVFAAVLAITYWRKTPYHVRAGIVLFILYILGLSGLLESGLSGDGRVFLIAFALMCAVFLGMRAGVASGALSVVTLAFVGFLMSTGRLSPPPIEVMANSGKAMDWTSGTIIFIALTAVAIISISLLTRGLEQTVANERRLAEDLRSERNSLEARVEERTVALERRALELEAAAKLARDISTSTELDELLNRSVEIIRDQFGFYHAGIFLMDEKNEFAVLKAATGSAGRALLERGHRLMAGEVGVVGVVVSKGEPRITEDVEADPFHYKNPLLPATRSEMAVALKIGETVIGALDVQSETPGVFTPQDTHILQAIADQLAVAIEKARLVEQLRRNLNEVQVRADDQVQSTWRTHLNETRQSRTYRSGSVESGASESSEAAQAFESGETVTGKALSGAEGGRPETVVAVPIRLRNQVIGVLDVRFDGNAATRDRIELLETTANRMALALENARLLEAIQVRAEREHVVSEISARVRSSSDIDNILRTAALELGRSLGISEVTVQLRPGK